MAISFVNVYSASLTNTVASVVVVAGDLIVVGIAYNNTWAQGTCGDTVNTYDPINTSCPAYPDTALNGYYAIASTSTTLTVTVSGVGTSYSGISVYVFSGNNTTLGSVLDVSALSTVESSASTAQTSASITTTNAADVLVCFWGQGYVSMSTPYWTENGTGFTLNVAQQFWASAYKIVSSTGAYDEAVTAQTATKAGSLIAAFKAAGGTTYQPYWMMGILD